MNVGLRSSSTVATAVGDAAYPPPSTGWWGWPADRRGLRAARDRRERGGGRRTSTPRC
ncbi:hypothetical protein QJS66_18180 [Kocuria rhizophila]|nr:hypothetical protein QJS66_18180 [Kocuria rhizophila]